MKYVLSIILFSFIIGQTHFDLNINETGESTLFIFENNITVFDINDEIGIFDSNGIIDSTGATGEILVGSGIWIGEQLEIIGIHSVNLSQFGGPILPGASEGNTIIVKIWKSSEEIEYIPTFDISAGSGLFDGLFSVVSNISCQEGYVVDECGVCGGLGAIYECGCYDIPDEYCDCNENIEDCAGVCNGFSYYDECGICDDIVSNDCELDCTGTWGGNTQIDECGICDGPGAIYECGCSDIPMDYCDCNENTEDCIGICGGNALIDNCGVCDGDGFACDNAEVVLSFYDLGGVMLTNIFYENLTGEVCLENVVMSSTEGTTLETFVGNCFTFTESSGNFPIYMKNNQAVAGFQFNISGLSILGVSGGAAADAGFTVSSSSSVVLGFSFSGASIDPAGDFYGCLDIDACNYDPNANITDDSCVYSEEGYDCDGNCLDEDCAGECGGTAEFDECGICGGSGPEFECEDGTYVCNESECEMGGGGGDGGGGDNGECTDGEILDCFGSCSPASWLGDGYCDESSVDFNCLELAYDMGDCEINFSNHVMPIISANCTGYCHSGTSSYDGGLNLESYSSLMAGGSSGPAVQPYYPDYSLLIQKLTGEAPGAQMPYGTDLQEPIWGSFNTIYYWIAQGAIGSDDEDGPCSEEGFIPDCNNLCFSQDLLGDGNCDDGEEEEADFNCIEFTFDSTDCPVGVLEFGNILYSNGAGSLEILMNCEFAVSNFQIEISGIAISEANGGNAETADFNISVSDSVIQGSVSDSLIFIPPNSGLLTVLEYNDILLDQICFENSEITTYNGITYEAVLGDCIEVSSELNGEELLPIQTEINSIYPNPFNPVTTIEFSVFEPEFIDVNIIDIKGRKIATVASDYYARGLHTVSWNAADHPSGMYIVQLASNKNSITRKIILAK